MSLSSGTRLGPYEILTLIDSGGMGEVYRARDTKLDRDVAIKVLPPAPREDPERLARFEREAKTLAALNHPNIAHIHGFEDSSGVPALVMELVEGATLADRIARGPLPLDEALPIARQIVEGLEAAHEQGIIHRDLKPANIKVRADGTVKILDFGLAKALEPKPSGINATQSPTMKTPAMMTGIGVILGTAAYMSPEQAVGKAVDRRSDLWAFGAVLLEMLTGKQVFAGETVSHVLAAVLNEEPDWTALPTSTPEPLRRLLRRCLEKDCKRRLADAADARLEIDDALTLPIGMSSALPVAGSLRRYVALVAASVLAGALVATFATWELTRSAAGPLPRMMRFNVDLGPDAVAGERTTVTLSHAGRQIIYPIRGADGTQKLATRRLDATTPTVLPGTDHGSDAFFSPDDESFGFMAEGKLKKTALRGGPIVTVCDARPFRGGVWLEDGTIVAALGIGVLSRIPAAGGAPEPLTTLVNGEATHRWPQALPGGHAILFTSSKTTGYYEDASLQVVSLDTKLVRTVLQGGYFGRYTSGYLTYLHQGVLWGIPFDPSRLALTGTASPLVENVASSQDYGSGDVDVSDDGSIAYRSGKTSSEWPVVWLDAIGNTQSLLQTPGSYYTPRLSPDGRYLALAQDIGSGRDIYTYDIQRGTTSRLSFNGRGNRSPVWAPDGAHLVYASDADKAIWWTRADGAGEAVRLLESKDTVIPWSFSPDGRRLAYTEIAAGARANIWILPLDASNLEHPKASKPEVFLATPANEGLGVAISPDGRWIAYHSDESGRDEVYVRPFQRATAGKWQLSTSGAEYPLWSRDGRTVFFLGQDNRIWVTEYTTRSDSLIPGVPRVWSATAIRPMTRSITPGLQPLDLARDGGRFAVLPADNAVDEGGSVHVNFLLNFFDVLRRQLR